MTNSFIHHPDGLIIFGNLAIPVTEFVAHYEPGYTLPEPYIGRLYTPGVEHKLIQPGNIAGEPANLNDPAMLGYVARKAEYEAAYLAFQNGAGVRNVDGEIVVQGPPTLTATDGVVTADNVDVEVITCDVGDAGYTGQITWTVTDPDGNQIIEVENMVGGVATLNLKAQVNDIGLHFVKAATLEYGHKTIAVEAV